MQTINVNFIMKKIYRSHSNRTSIDVCGNIFYCGAVDLENIRFVFYDQTIIIKDI